MMYLDSCVFLFYVFTSTFHNYITIQAAINRTILEKNNNIMTILMDAAVVTEVSLMAMGVLITLKL